MASSPMVASNCQLRAPSRPACRARQHCLPMFARQGDRSAAGHRSLISAAATRPQRRSWSRLRACQAEAAQQQRPAPAPQLPAAASAGVCGLAAAATLLLGAGPAQASTDVVAKWAASGLIFKDSVELIALDDQDVEGVTIYITDFKRSITEKLARDFFAEPSQASLTCAITGPVTFKNMEKVAGSEGQEIFAERKNLFNILQNKTLRVRRVYDQKNNTLIYVAYSTRFTSATDEGISTGRYRTSVCALPLVSAPAPAAEAAPAE